jgi:hypothetical protein
MMRANRSADAVDPGLACNESHRGDMPAETLDRIGVVKFGYDEADLR